MKPGPEKQFDPDTALEQAIEVFLSRGYEAASLNELTTAMGIGKKSLYDTFGNKRSLFLKSLAHYNQQSNSRIRAILFDDSGPSIVHNINTLFAKWLESHSKDGSKGCLIGTSIADFDTSDEEVASALRRSLEQVEDVLTEAVAKADANGELNLKTTPRNIARTLLCLSQGVALLGRVMTSGDILESAFKVAESEILSPA
ncbi:MAG: TetR/AcrR family transcriptional regulator [Symploca sp. SIO2E6]|nr:TetR/AcrR family transcriptional regulator [Symploca sp. SIO2E6]